MYVQLRRRGGEEGQRQQQQQPAGIRWVAAVTHQVGGVKVGGIH